MEKQFYRKKVIGQQTITFSFFRSSRNYLHRRAVSKQQNEHPKPAFPGHQCRYTCKH